MSYPKLVFKAALAMVAGLGIATSSWAASPATATLNVSGSVIQSCTVTTVAVGFGAYDPVANAAVDATGAVKVKCSKGSAAGITIGLTLSANASGSQRRMKDGVTSNYLNYKLYQPASGAPGAVCAYATDWDTTAVLTTSNDTTPGWGANAEKTFNVCGRVLAGEDAIVGSGYVDTAIAQVNF